MEKLNTNVENFIHVDHYSSVLKEVVVEIFMVPKNSTYLESFQKIVLG